MSNKRQIAVWGWGSHASRRIVPAIFSCEAFELAAVISRSAEKPAYRLIDGKDLRFCAPPEVLADPAIGTVYISTPSGLHYEHCLAALEAGKHVLCEKPLTLSLTHTRELIGVARRSNLFLAEVLVHLFHPQFQELRRLVASGMAGRILTVTCDFSVPLDKPGFRRTSALGGGAFWDMACYHVSVLNELFPEPPEVLRAILEFPSSGGPDEGGWALARLDSSAHAFLCWGYGRSYRNHLMIHGEAGGLEVDKVFSKPDDYDSTIETWDRFGVRTPIRTGRASSFVNMLNDFGQSIGNLALHTRWLDAAERQAVSMDRFSAATGAR